jgi:hypothetical protein
MAAYISRLYPLEHPMCPFQWKRSTKNLVVLKYVGSQYWCNLQALSYTMVCLEALSENPSLEEIWKKCFGDSLLLMASNP